MRSSRNSGASRSGIPGWIRPILPRKEWAAAGRRFEKVALRSHAQPRQRWTWKASMPSCGAPFRAGLRVLNSRSAGSPCPFSTGTVSLYRGTTRETDGSAKDVTANLRTIRSLPLRLSEDAGGRVSPRRSAALERRQFADGEEREELGEPLFANPRNAAAGSLRQLDPSVTAGGNLIYALRRGPPVTGALLPEGYSSARNEIRRSSGAVRMGNSAWTVRR